MGSKPGELLPLATGHLHRPVTALAPDEAIRPLLPERVAQRRSVRITIEPTHRQPVEHSASGGHGIDAVRRRVLGKPLEIIGQMDPARLHPARVLVDRKSTRLNSALQYKIH